MKPDPKLAVIAGFAAAFLLYGVMFLGSGVDSHAIETGCRALVAGDDIETVVSTLGIRGYQPGCDANGEGPSAGLPCTRRDFGAILQFPYLCEGDDCSLYWRLGEVACLVEIDPATMRVTSAAFMALGAAAEGSGS